MLHTIFIKCKVDVMYFIFIFISPSVLRFSVKKNQLIKNKRPYLLDFTFNGTNTKFHLIFFTVLLYSDEIVAVFVVMFLNCSPKF